MKGERAPKQKHKLVFSTLLQKSHAASVALEYMVKNGIRVILCRFFELVRRLRPAEWVSWAECAKSPNWPLIVRRLTRLAFCEKITLPFALSRLR